jgi:hypothetical protein
VPPLRRGCLKDRDATSTSILDEVADAEIHGAPVVLTKGDGLPGLQDPLEER